MIERIGSYMWVDDYKQPLDETFFFANAPVYEVIRVIEKTPLFFEAHMARLKASLAIKGLQFEVSDETVLKPALQWIADHNYVNFNLRIEIGLNGRHEETCIIMGIQGIYPDAEVYRSGVHVTLANIVRSNPHAKILFKEYQERVALIRNERRAFEVLLHDDTGKLSEGSRSNLFFISNDEILSPKGADVLLGISRQMLLKVSGEAGIPFREVDIYTASLDRFDAAFLSGTSIHLLPIATIDERVYPSAAHPLMCKLMTAFESRVRDDLEKMRRYTR